MMGEYSTEGLTLSRTNVRLFGRSAHGNSSVDNRTEYG